MEFWVGVLTYVVIMSVALVPMMATTGKWMHFDAISLVPILALTLAGVGGVGLAMGGVAMVFKRITAVAQILQFGFVGMIAAPVGRYPGFKALPLALGFSMMRRVMVEGESIFRQPATDFALLALNTAAYIALGAVIFTRMDRQARVRGLLGQY
jgi:ABC-2 type transport system permease protein